MHIQIFILILLIFGLSHLTDTSNHNRYHRSVSLSYIRPWPNAIVPYIIEDTINNTFDGNSEGLFSELDIKLIHKSMDIIESESCVKFKDLSNQNISFNLHVLKIKGRTVKGCHSDLGVVNGKTQELHLDSTCRSVGQIVHELLHTLGMMHEIMRPDRDRYIILQEQNIQRGYLQEFEKINGHYSVLSDRRFDFQSLSLYDPFTFTSNGNPVWQPKHKLIDTPLFSMSEKDLSFEDSAGLNRLYKCDAKCSKSKSPCRREEYRTKKCTCRSKEAYAYQRCRDDPNERAYCKDAVIKNKCYDEARYAIPYCRRSCGRCFRAGPFGVAPPPKKLCRDLEPTLCPNYIHEGYCHFDGWTKLNCQKSCNLCPSLEVARRQVETGDVGAYLEAYLKGKCFNRYDDLRCEVFAQRGDCKTNSGFMSSQCTQSCGLCLSGKNSSLPKAPCRNYIDDERCDALAKEGKCHGTTLKQCLGSCQKCGTNYTRNKPYTTQKPIVPTTPTPLKVIYKCEDHSPLCTSYAENGECHRHGDAMRSICPLSCGYCTRKCEDLDSPTLCAEIVQRGYCHRFQAYALRCEKSCGICLDSSEQIKPIINAPTRALKPKYSAPKVTTDDRLLFQTTHRTTTTTLPPQRTTEQIQLLPNPLKKSSTKSKQQNQMKTHTKFDDQDFENKDLCRDHLPKYICQSWTLAGYCNFPHVSQLCLKSCHQCETNRLLRKYRSLFFRHKL